MEARSAIASKGKLCKVHDPFPAHGHPRSRALERAFARSKGAWTPLRVSAPEMLSGSCARNS
jgi:hypothetical protein